MTLTQLRELSVLKLATAKPIAAVDLRAVFDAVFDFLKQQIPLATGSFSIGDITSSDVVRLVIFPDVGIDDYVVVGALKYIGTNFNANNDVIATTGEYTRTSFKIALREVSQNTQNLIFDWEIKAKS